MIIQRLFGRARPAPAVSRPRRRPELEALEERLVMNNRLVVPAIQADNVTRFASLQSALTTAGLRDGDTIQIEPGSAPGGIRNADLPKIANLTIRGDPTVRAEDLPAVDINDELLLQSNQANWSLINVHAECHGGGLELFRTDATIAACFISGVQTNGTAVINVDQASAAVLRDNHFESSDSTATVLIAVTPTNNDQDLITGNTLLAQDQFHGILLTYEGGISANNTAVNVPVGDRIVHNRFLGNATTSVALLVLANSFNGLDIEDNTFLSTAPRQTGLFVSGTNTAATVVHNEFHLTGQDAECIAILGTAANQVTDVAILGNRLDTAGQGGGLAIQNDIHGAVLKARVEGNDFHNNKFGAVVGAEDATDIDLGGGTQGSLGGNDFRGFTPSASLSVFNGAISASNFASTPSPVPIDARFNLFSVGDPGTVIFDHAHDATLPSVDAGGSLTGNAAFVQSLYLQFLHRAGNLNNPQDAHVWVTLLNNGTPEAVVADSVARSSEALGIQVEQLYQRLLGRDAGADEAAGWVSVLQHGQTLESVTGQIIGSAEYQGQLVDDTAFVRSLFRNLLQREGSASDIAGWVSALPALGRAGVTQDFLTSLEFRQDVIGEDYAGLLHRVAPPAAVEVNGWLASGLDALSLDVVFATSPEYQLNG
jgi:hypothetical protein